MKKFLTGLLVALTISFGLTAWASPVYADASTDAAKAQICEGVNGSGGSCGNGGVEIGKVLTGLLNTLSVIAGFVAVVMIFISGFKYTTSGGDAQAVSSAKKTLIYAIVGLLVTAFAQILVHFVLANV